MAHQATDSFMTEIDGVPVYVSKNQILPDGHPAVAALKDSHLFRHLEEETAPKRPVKARSTSSG